MKKVNKLFAFTHLHIYTFTHLHIYTCIMFLFISALGYSQSKNSLLKIATCAPTPRNTPVNFTTYTMSDNDATQVNWYRTNIFLQSSPPDEIVTADSSSSYNCFGFALGNSEGWMDPAEAMKFFDEENGYGDGSYSRVTDFNESEFIIYYGFAHIAIKSTPVPGYSQMVISKWRCADVIKHPLDSGNPYTNSNPYTYYARACDVGPINSNKEYNDINSAQNAAKSTQIVKVYGSHTLLTDVTLTNNLKVMSGSTVYLNNHYISGSNYNQNKNITINGTIGSSSYCYISSSSVVVAIYPTLSQAISVVGSGETITVYGSHTLSSDATVPSGSSIQFVSGSSVSGSTLTINGSLYSNGASFSCPVVINGSANCQWSTFTGGIAVNNTNSASFTNCSINSSYYGINVYNGYVALGYCRITNNTYGAYFTNYGHSAIAWTVFDGHYDAVKGDGNSYPAMSSSNSFRTASHFDVHSSASETIYATGNYWLNKDVTNNVNTSGELSVDPNPKKTIEPNEQIETPMFKKSAISKVSSLNESDELFNQARLLLIDRSYDSAIVIFKTIADNYGDSLVGRSSIAFIEFIMDKTEKSSEKLGMLDTYASKKGSIAPFAAYRKGYVYFKTGDYEKALDIMKNVTIAKDDIEMQKVKLYDLGLINYSCLGKKDEGLVYFNELAKNYPEDRLSEMACILYGAKKGEEDNDKNNAKSQIISGTALLANYPNPFNPSTVIKYNLGENTLVTLKVYDILGKEVRTLVNEYKTKGAYEVNFNGAGLASGLYFTKLQTGSTILIQKMVLAK
jgi:tetratricopeptide (TPR) repeat protein